MPSPTRAGEVLRARGRQGASAGDDFVPDDSYLDGLSAPFGRHAMTLGIGPLRVRLEGLSAGQTGERAGRYRPFVLEAGTGEIAPDLTIGLRQAGVDHFLAPAAGEVYRMGRRPSPRGLALWSYEFAGRIDVATRQARLALVASGGPLFDRGLENFLRVVIASYVVRQGGLLVHGSGVVRGGRAHIFFGPSGSGKTTVTHLSPHDRVLSDDLTLVVPCGGTFGACGIPFGMAHHRRPDSSAAFPIASLNRLVQSRDVRREPLARAQALAELGGSLPFVMQETGQAAQALETAARVLERIPAYRLFFRRDDSFWGVVGDREGGHDRSQ
jgi:hypothetical protein